MEFSLKAKMGNTNWRRSIQTYKLAIWALIEPVFKAFYLYPVDLISILIFLYGGGGVLWFGLKKCI